MRYAHELPNAINPLVTVIGMQVGFTIGGAIFVEQIFRWPGLGSYLFRAIQFSDYNAICAVTVILAAVFVITSTLADILNSLIDPRIRVS